MFKMKQLLFSCLLPNKLNLCIIAVNILFTYYYLNNNTV